MQPGSTSRPKIALVAGGGAARGLAHLGVLRACEELGVRPDMFVGTSSGALVAATYGQDIPLDVLLDGYRLPWRRRHDGPRIDLATFIGAPRARDLFDPGYLFSGLLSLDRLERKLRRMLPINDFTKLPSGVFVTAVDLDSGQRVIFGPGYDDRTPISQAVAASCCVPGLFRPFWIGDRAYVDGEVAEALPADVAVAAGATVVILSNPYRPERRAARMRPLARLGALRVARQAMSVALAENARRNVELLAKLSPRVAFLEIAPDLGRYAYLHRFATRSLVMRGYRAALRVLADAKERGLLDGAPPPGVTLN